MWQKVQERYGGDGFTVVGMALDAEGIAPAKLYYDKYKVTFPALVDPNYATKFTRVPYTFFIDEHGVVVKLLRGSKGIEKLIKPKDKLRPVTEAVRAKFSSPQKRLDPKALAALVKQHKKDPKNLRVAGQLASRYLDLKQVEKARSLLLDTVKHYHAKQVARKGDDSSKRLLAEAYFQLSRASIGDRKAQEKYATLSFYLSPSIGYGKQVARIIAPEKFDNRPKGDFDNAFREGTLRRLTKERKEWLADDGE